MSGFLTYVWIALGGAIGSMGRYWLTLVTTRAWGPEFPWGTILINIIGSFVIAFFGELTAAGGIAPAGFGARAFVMVGICGGFTTFSSFSLQTFGLLQSERWGWATANALVSVAACVFACAAGWYAASLIGRAVGSGR